MDRLFSYNFWKFGLDSTLPAPIPWAPRSMRLPVRKGLAMEQAALNPTESDSLPEKKFGGYTILDHLGKGGMGDVFKAVQPGLERVVALKILPSLLARNMEFSERFFTEAYAISRLQHQNIVTIYDYGEENGQKFIAMQYVQGVTLSKLIQQEKKLDYTRIISIAKQICRGLKYAHQNEIVHRDIKSGNIMVEPGDKVFISDFGIAKVVDAPSITTTGMAMGTPEYMAPEQCEGGVVDGQSDIYGLGVILFEMVAGRPPFLADTPLAVAYKQVHETPPLLSKKASDVPPRLELIVAKCLKKAKAERYLKADELLNDLDSAHLAYLDLAAPALPDPKTQMPSDLRITDRRGRERRYLPEAMAVSRSYLWGILGLFAIAFAGMAYLILRPSPSAGSGAAWLTSAVIHGEAAASGPSGDGATGNLSDGKRSTAWVAPAGKVEAELDVAFAGKVLITGVVVEAGYQSADGSAPAYATPRTLSLEVPGRKTVRLALADTDDPQFLAVPGLLTNEVHLRLAVPAGVAKPMAVREIRFLGLPYE